MIINWDESHPYGTCWINEKHKKIFINIPKNASSSMKQTLRRQGYKAGNFKNVELDNYYIFTILRDPFTRFISGYIEMMKRSKECVKRMHFYRAHENVRLSIFLDSVSSNCCDEHVIPQVEFLPSIACSFRVHFFEDLSDIKESIGQDLTIRRVVTPPNKTLKIINLLQPKDYIKIINLYKRDFLFYNQMKYVREYGNIRSYGLGR